MASDYFLKLDGIKGESADAKHKDEIEVLTFRFGTQQPRDMATGQATGKMHMQDFELVLRASKASPLLFQNCATGKIIKEGTITVRKAGGEQQEYYKIKMNNVLISKWEVDGLGDKGDSTPTDRVSLHFTKISLEYADQKKDGTLNAGTMASWDMKANTT